jgi:ABC-type nitrate/sulfonate/bicarbonate transport system substrate-binding protein
MGLQPPITPFTLTAGSVCISSYDGDGESSNPFFAVMLQRCSSRLALAIVSLLFSSPLEAQVATLRVGTNSPASAESVLFSIARDAGVLKQSQLDVEVIFIAGGTLSMQALIGKSLDFLCTGGTPYIVAYLEGAQTKMIGGVNNKLPYGFVSLPNIKTPAQLKGKRIGISRFGSTDDFAVKLALSQFGLNPKTDVSITQVGSAAYSFDRTSSRQHRRRRAHSRPRANRPAERSQPAARFHRERHRVPASRDHRPR